MGKRLRDAVLVRGRGRQQQRQTWDQGPFWRMVQHLVEMEMECYDLRN